MVVRMIKHIIGLKCQAQRPLKQIAKALNIAKGVRLAVPLAGR